MCFLRGADDDVGADAALGRHIAAGIFQHLVGAVIDRGDPDLLARGAHQVEVVGGRGIRERQRGQDGEESRLHLPGSDPT